MLPLLKKFVRKQTLFLKPVVARVQGVLVSFLLVLAYFLIVGPTWLFVIVFRRPLLRETCRSRGAEARGTYWLTPQGYGSDPELFRRQF